MDLTFQNGVTKSADRLINVIMERFGLVYHSLLAETLDRTSLVQKRLINKICELDATLVLIERTLQNWLS